MFIKRWLGKENLVYTKKKLLLIVIEKWKSVVNKKDGARGLYIKLNNLETKNIPESILHGR